MPGSREWPWLRDSEEDFGQLYAQRLDEWAERFDNHGRLLAYGFGRPGGNWREVELFLQFEHAVVQLRPVFPFLRRGDGTLQQADVLEIRMTPLGEE